MQINGCHLQPARVCSNNNFADVLCEYRGNFILTYNAVFVNTIVHIWLIRFTSFLPCETGERLTYADNEARCNTWGRSVCNPSRLGMNNGGTGQCMHHQCCRDQGASSSRLTFNKYHWTTAGCEIQVKVHPDGMIAIVHKPLGTVSAHTNSFLDSIFSFQLNSNIQYVALHGS